MPLISAGGAIHSILRQFGVRLPVAFDGVGRSYDGGYYGSSGYGNEFGRDGGGGGGAMETMGNMFKIAQAFM